MRGLDLGDVSHTKTYFYELLIIKILEAYTFLLYILVAVDSNVSDGTVVTGELKVVREDSYVEEV